MNTKEPSPGRSGHKDNPSRFFCKGIRRKNKGTKKQAALSLLLWNDRAAFLFTGQPAQASRQNNRKTGSGLKEMQSIRKNRLGSKAATGTGGTNHQDQSQAEKRSL